MQVLIDGSSGSAVGSYLATEFGLKTIELHSATKIPSRAILIGSINNRTEYKVLAARGFDPDHVILVSHTNGINLNERIGTLTAYYEGIVSTFVDPSTANLIKFATETIKGHI